MLTYDNLGLRFHPRWIFQNLSGSFKAGEFVGIMGPNGSGKSSFLKCLAGLLKPTEGKLFWNKKPLESYSIEDLSKVRAYGHADMQCAWDLTVQEILQLSGAYSLEKIEQTLSLLKASTLLDKKFSYLSGGERSLVTLALAFLQETPLLMLDEITAMLDEAYAHHVMHLLRQEAEKGKTVLMILHDKALAAHYCGRLLLHIYTIHPF